MPSTKDTLSDLAAGLAEHIEAPSRALSQLGEKASSLVESGKQKLRSLTAPGKRTTDIELPSRKSARSLQQRQQRLLRRQAGR